MAIKQMPKMFTFSIVWETVPYLLSTPTFSAIDLTHVRVDYSLTSKPDDIPATALGVCWNTTGNPTKSDTHDASAVNNTDATPVNRFANVSISQNETLFFRAYIDNVDSTIYSEEAVYTNSYSLLDNNLIIQVRPENPTVFSLFRTYKCKTAFDIQFKDADGNNVGSPYTFDDINNFPTAGDGISVPLPIAYDTDIQGAIISISSDDTYNYILSIADSVPHRTKITTIVYDRVGDLIVLDSSLNIQNYGTPTPTSRGICYSNTNPPTTADTVLSDDEFIDTETYFRRIIGEVVTFPYYVRGFVEYADYTVYSEVIMIEEVP